MIYQKLARIQRDLFVPKNQKNSFGNYNYRSCEDILKAVKPLCDDNKCVLSLTSDIVEQGGKNYIKAIARLTDLEDAESYESVAFAREEDSKKGMDASQISGSCLSYARKYALAGLFCIDNEKDSDATNTHGKSDDKKNQELVQQGREEMIKYVSKNYDEENLNKILEHYQVSELQFLTNEQLTEVYVHKKAGR